MILGYKGTSLACALHGEDNLAMLQWLNGAMLQSFNDAMLQSVNDSIAQ